jgi:chromosomal replication initiation ATPase DnaA
MLTPRERRTMKIREICERRGVALKDVMGRSRFKNVCLARKEAYVMLRGEGMLYPAIAKIFGRDHTTVIDGVRRYRNEQGIIQP